MSSSKGRRHGGNVPGGTGAAPRTVATGGKNQDGPNDALKDLTGLDSDTGERVQLYASGSRGVEVIRQMSPKPDAPDKVALVDALAISLVPPSEYLPELWVADQLRQFLSVNKLQQGKGYTGFKYSATWSNSSGLIAWGGKSQRGRVYVSIQGQGCATIQDWVGQAQWLALRTATIKRVDLAQDDFEGRNTDIARAVQQFVEGGFNAGGRQPVHQCYGDWLSGEQSTGGRTFGIGKRANGKFYSIYEKGKQLGDPQSAWVRVEVEWRAQRRHIPFEVLTQPGTYLAGAYPCLAVLSTAQARIRTTANAASIAFDAAIENARLQSGKLINLVLRVYGGDYAKVVERLRRDGIPARIEPYGHALSEAPERLDSSMPGSFADLRKTGDSSDSSTQ